MVTTIVRWHPWCWHSIFTNFNKFCCAYLAFFLQCAVLKSIITEWLGLLGSSSDICSSFAALRCSEPCLRGFEYLQGWRFHNLSGHPIPVFDHPQSKKVFLVFQWYTSQFPRLYVWSKLPGEILPSPSHRLRWVWQICSFSDFPSCPAWKWQWYVLSSSPQEVLLISMTFYKISRHFSGRSASTLNSHGHLHHVLWCLSAPVCLSAL